MTTLYWFRRDLRLTGNPLLHRAVSDDPCLIPIYVLEDEDAAAWAPGGASRWWLHHSLQALDAALRERGSRLLLRRGAAAQVLAQIAVSAGARRLVFAQRIEPWARRQAQAVARAMAALGVEVIQGPANLLHDPRQLRTGQGTPYRVFTPFWKNLSASLALPAPVAQIGSLSAPRAWPEGDQLAQWQLLPQRPDWSTGFAPQWQPGEAGALARLAHFTQVDMPSYAQHRDFPDSPSTSRLSPHLHFGEISPQQIWRACQAAGASGAASAAWPAGAEKFLSEIGWRDFCAHLLFHEPELPERALRRQFDAFPWIDAPQALRAWQQGLTGIPVVDAGMRELWTTGWMHNRVRMITASFLVKNLLVRWQEGEAWFRDTLVDADLASNAGGWQWVSGCGADAAPYFRVFNPVLQSQKFDPDGNYLRRWVPELAAVPARWIHAPWEAPGLELAAAGVILGRDYPAPIADLAATRARALQAYATLPRA